jgi:hypothetical protein
VEFLGRQGDSRGEQFWLTVLENGSLSLQLVAASFLASDEFFARANGR